MSAHTAAEAVDAIIDDMRARNGFSYPWAWLHPDTRAKVRSEWVSIIQQCLDDIMPKLTRQFREGDAI